MQGTPRNGKAGGRRVEIGDIKEEDIMKIMSYNVMALPALVVDEQVVAKGRKLSLAEVKELLTK